MRCLRINESISKHKQKGKENKTHKAVSVTYIPSCHSVSLLVVTVCEGEIKWHTQVWSTTGTLNTLCHGVLHSCSQGMPLLTWDPPSCCWRLSLSPEVKIEFPWSETVWPHQHGRLSGSHGPALHNQIDEKKQDLMTKCHNWRLLSWCVLSDLFAHLLGCLNACDVLIVKNSVK